MPIYEYACKSCGHRLEALQKISDALLTDCPECGDAGLEKQVSAAGFVLKGGGWYVTDFREKGKKKDPDGQSGEKSGNKSGDESGGKSDSKSGGPEGKKDDGGSADKSGASAACGTGSGAAD